jgi:hypothetical protein
VPTIETDRLTKRYDNHRGIEDVTAIVDGIDPLAFAGLTAAGIALAVVGTILFERRDLPR